MKCTCGSAAVFADKHSYYCDSMSQENGWNEFLRLSQQGWTGTYVYVTNDQWKLKSPLNYEKGVWLVVDPTDFKWSTLLQPTSVSKVWIEKPCDTEVVMEDAMIYTGHIGTVKVVEL